MRNTSLVSVFLGIIATFVVGVILLELRGVLMPFVLAMLLSVIFKPVVLGLKSRRVPVVISLVGVLIVFFVVLFLLGWLLFASAGALSDQLPAYEVRVREYLDGLEVYGASLLARFEVDLSEVRWSNAISLSSITAILSTGIGTFISFLGTTFLVMLFMMFILAGSGDLAKKVRFAFPEFYADRIATVVSNVDSQVRRYLVVKTLVSLATGLLTGLITAAFGVDFPIVWGFLAFMLNYIPNFGSLVAVLFPALLSLLQFGSPGLTIVLLVLLVGTQATMGNFMEPRIMGFSLNLSPLFILVSLIVWGWLWGFWGMALAVPMTATLKIVFENIEPLKPVSVLMGGWKDLEETPDLTEGAASLVNGVAAQAEPSGAAGASSSVA